MPVPNEKLTSGATQESGNTVVDNYDKSKGTYSHNVPCPPPTKALKYHGQTTPFTVGGK